MKIKKQIAIVIIMLILVLLLPTISRAGIESKPGGTVWTNITISEAYAACRALAGGASTLGNNTLDPHLALNKDWGAIAYLAISGYGAATTDEEKKQGGVTTEISGESYISTTGNPTGVMDFGKNYTWTSGIIAKATYDNYSSEYRENLTNALNNPATVKYVEGLDKTANTDVTKSKGMALAETRGWYDSLALWEKDYPCFQRKDACGFFGSNSSGSTYKGWLRTVRIRILLLDQQFGTR